jgi:hypothetical protein
MTTRLYEPTWRVRALARAQSLEGLGWEDWEQEVIDAWEDVHPEYGIFMAFGVCPERQSYINGTIQQLEDAEDLEGGEYRQKVLTAWVRLQWSCKELI